LKLGLAPALGKLGWFLRLSRSRGHRQITLSSSNSLLSYYIMDDNWICFGEWPRAGANLRPWDLPLSLGKIRRVEKPAAKKQPVLEAKELARIGSTRMPMIVFHEVSRAVGP
jgi:hypothetical protein